MKCNFHFSGKWQINQFTGIGKFEVIALTIALTILISITSNLSLLRLETLQNQVPIWQNEGENSIAVQNLDENKLLSI